MVETWDILGVVCLGVVCHKGVWNVLFHCRRIALTKLAVWQKLLGFIVHRNVRF